MKKFFSFVAAMLFAGSMMASTPLNTDFTKGQGSWTTNDVELDGISYVWKQDSKYGMKASAYVSKAAHAAESWLISPAFSLSEASTATLTINHAVNNGAPTAFKVKASADGTNWTDLALSAWPAGSSWTFEDATADLSAFAGEEAVQIAFVYVSTTDLCPTWEIKTVKVEDDATGGGEGGEGDEVVLDVVYADAAYSPTDGDWWFDFYKDYNEDTEELTYPEVQLDLVPKSATGIAGTYGMDEINWGFLVLAAGDTVEMVSISDVVITYAEATGYHYAFSFTGDDNKTYKVDADLETLAYNYDTKEDITLDEDGGEVTPPVSEDLATSGVHVLKPTDVTDEAEAQGSFKKVVDGIQIEWEGAYYNGTNKASNNDFRVYANKTMTITAGANIVKVEIAGLAKKDQEVSVNHGTITVGGEKFAAETTKSDIEDPLIKIEEIGATSVTLTCTKQLQARIIRVTLEGAEGIEETLAEGKAVKVIREGNILIMKGDKVYNAMGQIVK